MSPFKGTLEASLAGSPFMEHPSRVPVKRHLKGTLESGLQELPPLSPLPSSLSSIQDPLEDPFSRGNPSKEA